jgi:hypothetical protein
MQYADGQGDGVRFSPIRGSQRPWWERLLRWWCGLDTLDQVMFLVGGACVVFVALNAFWPW